MMLSNLRAFGKAFLGLSLALFLGACQSAIKGDIVGRWEMDEDVLNWAYEFYDDGTGVFFSSPYQVSDFSYVYDSKEILETTDINTQITQTLHITFKSNDSFEMQIEHIDGKLTNPTLFKRAPLPQVPAHARVKLGIVLTGSEYEIISAEKVEDQNSLNLDSYQIVYLTEVTFDVGMMPEEWHVTVNVDGNDQPREFLLVEHEQVWGVIELVKQ